MRVLLDDLTLPDVAARLAARGVVLRTGPVSFRVRSRLPLVAQGLVACYGQHPVVEDPESFVDFHVAVDWPVGMRRWWRPLAVFRFDGQEPFTPLPAAQGFPLLEWGLNWCMYSHCNQYLISHSAVLERKGLALVLPAPSGSGKSTLCAALAFNGWRLMSDELGLFDPATGWLSALPRPISLKNRSIDILRDYAPQAVLGSLVDDTLKGTVGHVRPPADALALADVAARPRWIVFPRFAEGADTVLVPISPGRAFMALMAQCFNYSQLGHTGFDALVRIIEGCESYQLTYSRLDEALLLFDRLADRG